MTRNEWLALAGLAALAVIVVWQQGTGSHAPEVMGAVEGVTWKARYPEGHEHLALPWDIGSVIWGPHPIYCDPDGPGKFRDPLIKEGWAWMSSPPSEEPI